MKKILETERLFLRELETSDVDELAEILCDSESMKYYPRPFTRQEVDKWIKRNIDSYTKYKHGLWAVIQKEQNIFLGECGITMQHIDEEYLPELGYHINKRYCCNGYTTEAAGACIDYAFNKLGIKVLYLYTNPANIPSIRVAQKIGMKFVKEFKKNVMGTIVDEVLYSYADNNN